MANYEGFWNWVDREMEARGLNYANLERAAGLSNAAISKYARAWARPPVGVCIAIAKVLSVSADYVLWLAGRMPKPVGDLASIPYLQELVESLSLMSPDERRRIMAAVLALLQVQAVVNQKDVLRQPAEFE